MRNESVNLPYGYSIAQRTREDGGGYVLYGGVIRHRGKVLGPRPVISWDKGMPKELLENIARHDYHGNTDVTERERMVGRRQFVLAITPDGYAGSNLPEAKGENKESAEDVRNLRTRMKLVWGEAA